MDGNSHLLKLNNCKIKIFEISLLQLSGKYEDWNMFKTEFNNIVRNNKELTEAQKFHYLTSVLRSEAEIINSRLYT